MRKSFFSLAFLLLTLGWAPNAHCQYNDMIKNEVNEALKTYLKNVSPKKGCACNACKFTYTNSMKIDRSKKYSDKLLLWGKAKTSFKSSFNGGGNKLVEFYAEVKKMGSDFVVTKLKWRTLDPCMKMATLLEE